MSGQLAIFTVCRARSGLGDTVEQTVNDRTPHRADILVGDEDREQTGKWNVQHASWSQVLRKPTAGKGSKCLLREGSGRDSGS